MTYVALANSWIIINVGGGPTDDKPTVTLETPPDPDRVNSFLNIRVADIDAVYAEWSAAGRRVPHAAEEARDRDALLHPRPGRVHHRGRTDDSAAGLASAVPVSGAHQPGQDVFRSVLPEEVEWQPFPAFPPSARLAVVVGRPTEPGPYVIRVKVPAGVKLMPHRHPEDRVYTVISGVFYIGLGDQFDAERLTAYPPGAVVVLPGELPISTGRGPASTSPR